MTRAAFGMRNVATSTVTAPSNTSNAVAHMEGTEELLAVGLGRSYGDVGIINGGLTLSSNFLNKFLNFDPELGRLTCQSGVTLADIQATFVKKGWMLPVTPGTALVSLGGAIANDVHGKDHHAFGTFGEHVLSLKLLRSDGQILECSKTQNAGLFYATIGGLGLTGMILEASVQLRPAAGPYIDAEIVTFSGLREFFEISAETAAAGWQASVAWFDCSTSKFGRGSFTRGNPSDEEYNPSRDDHRLDTKRTKIGMPIVPPFSLVNKASLNVFNNTYFNLQKAQSGAKRMHFQDFYYPLDGVSNWNRIYGPKGFFQYQSVIPVAHAEAATDEMLAVIQHSGQGSFLGVLKMFADREPAGLLSFAQEGITLALDFPDRGHRTLRLFEKLDGIVSKAGGRLNPSKDGRMSREMFRSGYPRLEEFRKHRDAAFVSEFSRRLID